MYKTVLLITPFYHGIGGAETSLRTLVKLLRKRGIKIVVVTHKFNLKLFNWLEGHKWLTALYIIPLLFVKSLFWATVMGRSLGVIHGAGVMGGLVSNIVGKLFRKPYVVSTHCLYEGIYKLGKVERSVFKKAKKVFCLSESSKMELGLYIGSHNGVIYRTLIDWELFRPDSKYSQMDNLLFISRPIKKKGWDIMMKLKERFEIIMLSSVDNNFLPGMFRNARLTLTAAQHPECFSRVILESLFCDTPVIASNKDIARFTIPEKYVKFVEPTVEGLTKAIKAFKECKPKPKGYYRNYAMKEFGEKNLEIFIDVYKPYII